MTPKRYRKPGNLTQLRAVLWRTVLEVEALLDTRPASNDLVLRAAHALSQLAGSYTRLIEVEELAERLTKLEEEVNRRERTQTHPTTNGRHA